VEQGLVAVVVVEGAAVVVEAAAVVAVCGWPCVLYAPQGWAAAVWGASRLAELHCLLL
jgi:hypothetical protein